jgi:preprotein translocase subunit SecD
MKTWPRNINGIFCALALICFFSACETTGDKADKAAAKKDKKLKAIVGVHVEAVPDGSRTTAVPVFRANPMMITINASPFVNNADVVEARLVDLEGGGWGMSLTFDNHGRMALDNITSRNNGKHLVVYVAFPEIRWLAAPRIGRRIADGILIFTPDCTHEEAEQIVKGINNVAKQAQKSLLK